jgi:hypothetical protein
MNGESANNVDINFPAIDSTLAYANIDLFARHVYGDRATNLWESKSKVRKVTRDDNGKDVWMTEHNINSANAAGYYNDSKWDYIWKFMNDIDRVMRLNNENAFVWWAGKRFYSMVGDGQYGTPNGQALPRGWGLSHYAKYTIDTTRIGFTFSDTSKVGVGGPDVSASNVNANYGANDMDSTSVRITAYISQDGKEISLVMWTPTLNTGSGGYDMGTIEIAMPAGFLIDGATGIRSYKNSATQNTYQAPYAMPVSSDRTKAYVRLPNSEIISVKFTKKDVVFSSVTATGTPTTTSLSLTFNQPIPGLSADDITLSGVAGVTKGTLTGTGPTYTLPISGFDSGGNLSVAVAKTSYTINDSPKTVTIIKE